MVTVGTVASRESGVVVVASGGGWVVLQGAGMLVLSPALARSLAGLLERAADVAERCVCVALPSGQTVRNIACAQHRCGR